MNSPKRVNLSYTNKLLLAMTALAVLVILLHLVFNFISVVIFDQKHGFMYELSNRFDLNDENSVPQWLTQALFLAISISAFFAYRLTLGSGLSRLWLAVSVLGVLLSLDDVATIHEFVLQSLHNRYFTDLKPSLFANSWLLVLPVVLIFLSLLFLWALATLPRRTSLLFGLGAIVFVLGAIIVDSVANYFPIDSFMSQGVIGAIEGGLQIAGSLIVLYSIVDYIERHHYLAMSAAWSRLRTESD